MREVYVGRVGIEEIGTAAFEACEHEMGKSLQIPK